MNLFVKRHQLLLEQLLNAQVDFIIIGGYSVIFHGYERTTGDVDIWLKPDNNNKRKLLPVLEDIGMDVTALEDVNFSEHFVFSIWEKPQKVDFITIISLVTYEEADKLKIIADCDGLQIPFLHLSHLVLSKINTGRPQDTADIDQLQKINQARNK